MEIRLVDKNWRTTLLDAAKGAGSIRIICPFIKKPVVEAILNLASARCVEVITRLNTADFFQNVSDVSALKLLLEKGARIKVVKNLHAKLYKQHVPRRDIARSADIVARPWKQKWPYYIRVHRAVFIAGTLANGISIHEMMDDLEHEAFESTSVNFREGKGRTTNPRDTLRQAHSRKLSSVSHGWLLKRFQDAVDWHGRIPESDLSVLDWPSFAK